MRRGLCQQTMREQRQSAESEREDPGEWRAGRGLRRGTRRVSPVTVGRDSGFVVVVVAVG